MGVTKLAGVALLATSLASPPCLADPPVVSRDDDPVLVLGTAFPEFLGRDIDDLALFRWNDATSIFEAVPFQIDERVLRQFSPGTPLAASETIYDVEGLEDGTLDLDDELAAMFGDAGPPAPSEAAWPPGAEGVRYAIRVHDPRPSAPRATAWLYLFAGTELPRSSVAYVSWNGTASGTISTDAFAVAYEDRWLFTEFRVLAPAGDGSDLLDRLKGRAGTLEADAEDEESWNNLSTYLGGIVGPVRAIRYVRGAASAVNTIHHDIVYRALWDRHLNLRVHEIPCLTFYFDWLPRSAALLFTPNARAGITVDGVPDAFDDAYADWGLYRSSSGGAMVLRDLPLSSLYGTRALFYRDDASYDDAIPTNPSYDDDDHSAYGSMGTRVLNLRNCVASVVPFRVLLRPLASDVGDADLADAYDEMRDLPLVVSTEREIPGVAAVRSVRASREGTDVVLSWDAIDGAVGYRVYAAEAAGAERGEWELVVETTGLTVRDEEAEPGGARYYSVVALGPEGEGPW